MSLNTWIEYLKDPYLVARFQQYFGVKNEVKKNTNSTRIPANLTAENLKRRDGTNGKGKLTEFSSNRFEDSSGISSGGSSIVDNDSSRSSSVSGSGNENDEDSSSSGSDETVKRFVGNKLWYYLFLFGSGMGDEAFYACFFSFWFWNVDGSVIRRVVFVWAILMYIGQGLKDIIKWPRPASPPVIRLERKWELEYGMPSTHAIVGAAVPFSIIIFTSSRYQENMFHRCFKKSSMQNLLVILFLAVLITFGWAELNIDPPVDSADCSKEVTLKHQRRLFFKYRGLWDFRNHLFSKEHKDKPGSVLFINWQADVLSLSCPCEGAVKKWTQLGLGIESKLFNDDNENKDDKIVNKELNFKAPRDSIYYRTYGCFTEKEHHYFNVFTRPGPETDFPVSFTEKEKDKLTWSCYITTMRLANRYCTHEPFKFSWIFPNKNDIKRRPQTTQKLNGVFLVKEFNITITNNGTSVVEKRGPKIHHICLTPSRDHSKQAVESRSKMGISNIALEGSSELNITDTDGALNAKHAGIYECIVTDRNGLSSSYEYDNLDDSKPTKKEHAVTFGGTVHVHIRVWFWIIVPIVLIIGILFLTILCIFALPDNREDIEQQKKEQLAKEKFEREYLIQDITETSVVSTSPPPLPSKIIPPVVAVPLQDANIIEQDIIAGLSLVALLFWWVIPFVDWLDPIFLQHDFGGLFLFLVAAVLAMCSPGGDRWTPARGDTVVILGSCVGLNTGAWMNYQLGIIHGPPLSPPYPVIWPSYGMFGMSLLRLVIGLSVVVATRAIVKSAAYATLRGLVGSKDKSYITSATKREVIVELTYKFITYSTVGFNVVYLAPVVFRLLGIERPTFHTEV